MLKKEIATAEDFYYWLFDTPRGDSPSATNNWAYLLPKFHFRNFPLEKTPALIEVSGIDSQLASLGYKLVKGNQGSYLSEPIRSWAKVYPNGTEVTITLNTSRETIVLPWSDIIKSRNPKNWPADQRSSTNFVIDIKFPDNNKDQHKKAFTFVARELDRLFAFAVNPGYFTRFFP